VPRAGDLALVHNARPARGVRWGRSAARFGEYRYVPGRPTTPAGAAAHTPSKDYSHVRRKTTTSWGHIRPRLWVPQAPRPKSNNARTSPHRQRGPRRNPEHAQAVIVIRSRDRPSRPGTERGQRTFQGNGPQQRVGALPARPLCERAPRRATHTTAAAASTRCFSTLRAPTRAAGNFAPPATRIHARTFFIGHLGFRGARPAASRHSPIGACFQEPQPRREFVYQSPRALQSVSVARFSRGGPTAGETPSTRHRLARPSPSFGARR